MKTPEPSISLCLALGASIANREKHLFDHRDRTVRRDAGRRIVPRGQNSAFVGMGISEDFCQPCSSHSRIAPTSSRINLAHPSMIETPVGAPSSTASQSPPAVQHESLRLPVVPRPVSDSRPMAQTGLPAVGPRLVMLVRLATSGIIYMTGKRQPYRPDGCTSIRMPCLSHKAVLRRGAEESHRSLD
jgi:hypothetical protein